MTKVTNTAAKAAKKTASKKTASKKVATNNVATVVEASLESLRVAKDTTDQAEKTPLEQLVLINLHHKLAYNGKLGTIALDRNIKREAAMIEKIEAAPVAEVLPKLLAALVATYKPSKGQYANCHWFNTKIRAKSGGFIKLEQASFLYIDGRSDEDDAIIALLREGGDEAAQKLLEQCHATIFNGAEEDAEADF